MPRKKTSSLRCPTCRKIVLASDPEFPFCSERCRTIDLGKWASGAYMISSPITDPESGGEAEYNEAPMRRQGGRLNDPDAVRQKNKPEVEGREDFHGSRQPN